MSKFTFPITSAYALTPQTNWSIGIYQHRSIPADSTDSYQIIDTKYQNRPDLHANDLYGNPDLYWVFMVRNLSVIRDPIWDHIAGKEIYLPSSERLQKLGIK